MKKLEQIALILSLGGFSYLYFIAGDVENSLFALIGVVHFYHLALKRFENANIAHLIYQTTEQIRKNEKYIDGVKDEVVEILDTIEDQIQYITKEPKQ